MTDANLMEANCIHGNVWYECNTCGNEIAEILDPTVDNSIAEPVGPEPSRESGETS